MNTSEIQIKEIRAAFNYGLRPDKIYSIAEWANKNRILPQGSAEPGPYRTDRTPYINEVYKQLDNRSGVDQVYVMKGAQLGFTESGNNVVGSWIANSPGNIMIVQPTVVTAKEYVQQRIDTMINSTPVLSERVVKPRSRLGSNTSRLKEFPGGFLTTTGANSASGLSSKPVKYLFLDEVDRYPLDVDGQGDPVKLAMQRLSTYARSKVLAVSTPTNKGVSRIEKLLNNFGYRQYFMPCPHCGEKIIFDFENLKWDNDNPDTVKMACNHCSALIDESKKTEMMQAGEWCDVVPQTKLNVVCYQISALYSPIGWRSWSDIVSDFISAKHALDRGDSSSMKAFYNLDLGLPYEDSVANQSIEVLRSRREAYKMGVVPDGAIVLTAGVDIQGNRIEALCVGWGPQEESWVIDYRVIYGDPQSAEPWQELDKWLTAPRHGLSGGQYSVSACCVDSGYLSQPVYDFCTPRKSRNVIAIKGSSQAGRPIIGRPSKVDVHRSGRFVRSGATVWPVGSDTGKTLIYGRLKISTPGAGYIHFPADADDDFLSQITSERVVIRYIKGFAKREWVKDSGVRNEALDCLNYALAAAHLIGVHRFSAAEWQRRSVIKKESASLFDDINEDEKEKNKLPSTQQEPQKLRQNIYRQRKRGWL